MSAASFAAPNPQICHFCSRPVRACYQSQDRQGLGLIVPPSLLPAHEVIE
jgi:hypothetical protein